MGLLGNLLFGDGNKTSYKDAAYDKFYKDISSSTFDDMYGGMTDYMDKNYGGGMNQFKMDTMSSLDENAKNSLANYNKTKNQYLGNGLIGNVVNPWIQTIGAAGDLANLAVSGGKNNAWDEDLIGAKRDVGSDLGALGNVALDVASGGLAKAGKAGKLAEKTLGQKMLGAGALGAGYGATGYLNDAGFENFDPSAMALSTAMGAGMGAGMVGLGAGVGKLQDYAKNNRKVVTNNPASTQPLQNALDTLNTANGTRYSANPTNLPTLRGVGTLDELDANTLKDLYKKASRNTHPDLGGSAQAFSQVNDANKVLNDWIAGGKVMPSNTTISYPGLAKSGFGQTLQGAGDLFKNNRLAKVGAGVGGGLLLGKLLSGGGSTGTPTYTDGMGNYYDENGNLIGGM